jgi:D-alanyl-D-alanine carboxypeptidase
MYRTVHWFIVLSTLGYIFMQNFMMALSTSKLGESTQMQTLNQQVKSELDRLQSKYNFPGVTAAYVLFDGTIGEVASGLADIETKEPMTTKSRMLAASIGKTFVAATIVNLAKESRLNLDDPLSKWLGGCSWYSRLPNCKAITLRHLLTHSSGLPDHLYTTRFLQSLPDRWLDANSHFSPQSLIECILDQTPLFEAGNGWAYTDTGYILLGLVIETITKNSYYKELDRRFLKPLKLYMTNPSDQRTLPDIVSGYTAKDNAFGLPRKTVDESGKMVWNPAVEWTGGGLISSSRDLAVWAKLLYEGHAMQADYLTDLFQSVPTGDEEPKVRYGAGVLIEQRGPLGPNWGHGGVIPGYCSSMRYYPRYGVAVAFQINTDSGLSDHSMDVSDIEYRLAEIIIKESALQN